MKKLLLFCSVGLLIGSVANAATIQTFNAVTTGTLTGGAVVGPTTMTGAGTATLDDSGVLTLVTSSVLIGGTILGPLDVSLGSTNLLSGTLTGLVLDPYTSTIIVNSCAENGAPTGVCGFVPLGPPGSTAPGGLPIAFNIVPGGITIFSGIDDLGAAAGVPGFFILNSTTTLTAVPEPTTAALLIIGLAVLGGARKRS